MSRNKRTTGDVEAEKLWNENESILLAFAKFNLGRELDVLNLLEGEEDEDVVTGLNQTGETLAIEERRLNGEFSVRSFQSEVIKEFVHFEKWLMKKTDTFEGCMLASQLKYVNSRNELVPIRDSVKARVPMKNIIAAVSTISVGDQVMAYPVVGEVKEKDQCVNLRLVAIVCTILRRLPVQVNSSMYTLEFPINMFAITSTVVTEYLNHRYNGEVVEIDESLHMPVEDNVTEDADEPQQFTHYPSANKAQWAIGKVLTLLELPNVVRIPKLLDMFKKWKGCHKTVQCPALQLVRDLPWIKLKVFSWRNENGEVYVQMVWAMVLFSFVLMCRCSEMTTYCPRDGHNKCFALKA